MLGVQESSLHSFSRLCVYVCVYIWMCMCMLFTQLFVHDDDFLMFALCSSLGDKDHVDDIINYIMAKC